MMCACGTTELATCWGSPVEDDPDVFLLPSSTGSPIEICPLDSDDEDDQPSLYQQQSSSQFLCQDDEDHNDDGEYTESRIEDENHFLEREDNRRREQNRQL
mmetsp:Transcript_9593/g.11812  ORF Transcript_9593/g.11812 Transcript_9593/m.11812 type:complete len:101 (-) Transcript_9593:898-1200(-)